MPDSEEIQRRKRELYEDLMIAEARHQGARQVREALQKAGYSGAVLRSADEVLERLALEYAAARGAEQEYLREIGR
jgi:hypothetical protein